MEDVGLMSQYRPDTNSPLEQLRKIVEPVTPTSLNAQIEALSDKQREHLKTLVSSLKVSMSFTRVNDRYADYKTLIEASMLTQKTLSNSTRHIRNPNTC